MLQAVTDREVDAVAGTAENHTLQAMDVSFVLFTQHQSVFLKLARHDARSMFVEIIPTHPSASLACIHTVEMYAPLQCGSSHNPRGSTYEARSCSILLRPAVKF